MPEYTNPIPANGVRVEVLEAEIRGAVGGASDAVVVLDGPKSVVRTTTAATLTGPQQTALASTIAAHDGRRPAYHESVHAHAAPPTSADSFAAGHAAAHQWCDTATGDLWVCYGDGLWRNQRTGATT